MRPTTEKKFIIERLRCNYDHEAAFELLSDSTQLDKDEIIELETVAFDLKLVVNPLDIDFNELPNKPQIVIIQTRVITEPFHLIDFVLITSTRVFYQFEEWPGYFELKRQELQKQRKELSEQFRAANLKSSIHPLILHSTVACVVAFVVSALLTMFVWN